ncbi:hypothetical protein NXS19_011525 [Fusarium pseudograminearum]|nr:hypothetical protein NXS19_011525 [Fusarium pseudograminearum]
MFSAGRRISNYTIAWAVKRYSSCKTPDYMLSRYAQIRPAERIILFPNIDETTYQSNSQTEKARKTPPVIYW